MASSHGSDASKDALETRYTSLNTSLPPRLRHRLDGDIASHLLALPEYDRAEVLLAYIAFHDEPDTSRIIARAFRDGKRVALSRLDGNPATLRFYEIGSSTRLESGARGVLEPVVDGDAAPLGADELWGSICLVPGLVFDAEGYRVAYGAGYYDDFLAGYPGLRVGLARGLQIGSNPLPHDDHDVAVDVIVSDGAIWRCRKPPV